MAAKTIKGITIEIDGNATKLGKVLKGLDDNSKDLAASLKYVDQLLELDPGNTELVAEKQGILAESIDTTSKKLEALRDVQAQVKRQYADGEIGQRAYLDFQAEIVRTEKKLSSLRAESDRLEASLDKVGDGAKGMSADFEKLDISAGNAAEANEDLDISFSSLAGGSMGVVAGIVTGIGTALIGTAESTREYREEMAKLDVSFGTAKLSVEAADEAYRILYRTLGETDQSVEAAQQIALLADSTERVVAWAELAPGLIARMGDALQPETFYEAANETLALNEATGAYVQLLEACHMDVEAFNAGLAACTTEQDKQTYMLQVTEQLLGEAGEAYKELNSTVMESRDADARLTEALAQMGAEVDPVITDVKNLAASCVENLVPAVKSAIDWGGMVIGNWGEMKEGLAMLGEGFALIGEDIKAGWENSMNWVKEQGESLEGSWGNVKKGLGDLKQGFLEIGEDIKAGWENSMNWVKDQGESLEGSWGNVKKGLGDLKQGFLEIGEDIKAGWENSMNWVKDQGESLEGSWDNVKKGLGDLKQGFLEIGEDIKDDWEKSVNFVKGLMDFEWSWPKLPMPHFTISGEFSWNPLSVPTIGVSWYAKGGILNNPTLFGFMGGNFLGGGEAGQEAVLPLDSFYDRLDSMLAQRNANSQLIVNFEIAHFENRTEADLDELVAMTGDKLMTYLEKEAAAI